MTLARALTVSVLAGLLAVTGSLAALAAAAGTSSRGCPGYSSGLVADLTDAQTANARVILAVGQQRAMPPRGLLIALMTAAQESGLRNLDHGDRDSLGLFQQRPSQGWGTPEQVRDPAYAAAAFYGGAGSPTRNPGLLNIPGWQTMPPSGAAQAVQRSAYPDAYARWETPARTWLAQLLPHGSADQVGGGCDGGSGASPAAQAAIAAAAKWLGTPYAWGGGDLNGPTRGIAQGAGTVGFDCSGLTRYAFAQAGIPLPRTAEQQWSAPGLRIATFAALQPGDLLFFATNPANPATIHHVAIALGHDSMIEAPRTGDVVRITQGISTNPYWAPEFAGALRVVAAASGGLTHRGGGDTSHHAPPGSTLCVKPALTWTPSAHADEGTVANCMDTQSLDHMQGRRHR